MMSARMPHGDTSCRRGTGILAFTLIELLVVVSILALLVSILLPSLKGARDQAKSVVCGSNIRQLALANELYANDHEGRFAPGAADILTLNSHRWHGVRPNPSAVFQAEGGPLTPYLNSGNGIRACPALRIEGPENDPSRFERNSGGYGYNNAFLGRQLKDAGFGFFKIDSDRIGALRDKVRRPAETVMFTDSAFADAKLIEYSFTEPRRFPVYGTRPDPSIHFRHSLTAHVAWCDGHVDRQKRSFTWSSGFYRSDPEKMNLGWFGQRDDNSLFDLK